MAAGAGAGCAGGRAVCVCGEVYEDLLQAELREPAAYAEAPAGTTMLLTGVMSKMGVVSVVDLARVAETAEVTPISAMPTS